MTPGIIARMQPVPGAGLELPAVATTNATITITVTAVPAIARKRSRRVNLRSGVFVRRQCPSRGTPRPA
jgi:hypothetical protein